MGQRLVVTIKENDTEIAAMYFHWSAYTMSSLMITSEIIDVINDNENEIKDLKLRLIRWVENEGGCIDGGESSNEFREIQAMYPNEKFAVTGSRNDGLIALTEEGISSMQDWSEGDVYINLDEGKVYNYVNWEYEDIDSFNESYEEDRKLDDIPDIKTDIVEFKFDEIGKVIKALNSSGDWVVRNGNTIYQIIE